MYNNLYFETSAMTHHTNNRNQKLHSQPHYTEDYFKEARVVFGSKENGLGYDYDDRLWQHDYEKHEKAWEEACNSKFTKYSANFYEFYLSKYFDKKVHLGCVMAGVNRSNGYPYVVFGYKFVD